jgi:hypothetical protein
VLVRLKHGLQVLSGNAASATTTQKASASTLRALDVKAPAATWGREGYILGTAYAVFALFLVLFSSQGDLYYIDYVANFVSLGHIDVYRYFSATPSLRPIQTVFPPLFYALAGLYLKVLSVLHLNPVTTVPRDMFLTLYGGVDRAHVIPGLLVLKLPNIAALLVGLWLMRKVVLAVGGDWRVGAVLWLASPIVLWAVLMQGQNDLLPAVATLAALALYQRQGGIWTVLLLGVAAGLKSYTVLLIPVTAVLLSNRNVVSIIKLCVIGAIPMVVIFGPFVSHDFIVRVVRAHDAGSLLSGFHWPLFYLCILGLAWVVSRDRIDIIRLAAMWLLTLLSIFVLTWWLPQWGVWLLPMVVLIAVRDRWMLWAWIATNAVVVFANLIRFPGNMDGTLLYPLFGVHRGYGHLLLLPTSVGQKLAIVFSSICWVAFAVLAVRAVQWILWPESVDTPESRAWIGSSYALKVSLLAPAVMLVVIAIMAAQNTIPRIG